MAAPTIDGHAASAPNGGSSKSITLTTTLTNDIIVVAVYNEPNSTTPQTVASISGGGLTWQRRGGYSKTAGSNRSTIEIWWALAASALSATSITVNLTGTTDGWGLVAFGVNGCNTSRPWDPHFSLPATADPTTGVSPSIAGISTLGVNSLLICAFGQIWNNGTDRTNVPTGFSQIDGAGESAAALFSEISVASKAVTSVQTGITVAWGTLGTASGPMMIVDALAADTTFTTPGLGYLAKSPGPVLAQSRWLNKLVLSVPFATKDTTPKNLVNGALSTVTGTLGWSGGPWGPARDSATLGGTNYETFALPSPIDWANGPFTIEAWITFRSFAAGGVPISAVCYNGDDSNPIVMRLGDAGLAGTKPQWGLGFGTKLSSGTPLAASTPCQLVMTFGVGALRGYINGALDSSNASATSTGSASSTIVLFKDDSTGRGPDAQCHGLNAWNRVLSADEIADRYRDLGGLWRPRRPTADYLAAIVAGLPVAVKRYRTLLGVGS